VGKALPSHFVLRPSEHIPSFVVVVAVHVDGVRLCLETAAETGLFIIPQTIGLYEYEEKRPNGVDRENRRTQTETCPSFTFSSTCPKWTDPGANPGIRGERLATNPLNALVIIAIIK
jgi:hypothetical protein